MHKKLTTKLIMMMLGGTIFSIILVSVITNITLFRKFDLYMRQEQENRLWQIKQLTEQSYSIRDGWTGEALDIISKSPLVANYDIELKDNDGNIIFSHYIETAFIRMHEEMMRRMGHTMIGSHYNIIGNSLRDYNYITEKYELNYRGETIGELNIGHLGPFIASERNLEFTKGINISILYGTVISILASIFLGLYTSNTFSRPILKITEGANRIREGKLDTNINITDSVIELQDLSKTINHLAKTLKEQEELRKRLTSDVSHELRTPLTILQAHIEALNDGVWEPTQDKLNILREEVLRLIRLVDDLKHLTEIEKYDMKLNIENYLISNDVRQIIQSFSYMIKEKGISLSIEIMDNIYITGDRDKIKQIIVNLLANAIKFTNPGGLIKVTLLTERTSVKLTIEDNGVGIDEKDLPYIFERFYKGDLSRNRKDGGAGIGLTISKKLVEAHGGSITVISKLNQGTKFSVILPLGS